MTYLGNASDKFSKRTFSARFFKPQVLIEICRLRLSLLISDHLGQPIPPPDTKNHRLKNHEKCWKNQQQKSHTKIPSLPRAPTQPAPAIFSVFATSSRPIFDERNYFFVPNVFVHCKLCLYTPRNIVGAPGARCAGARVTQ